MKCGRSAHYQSCIQKETFSQFENLYIFLNWSEKEKCVRKIKLSEIVELYVWIKR